MPTQTVLWTALPNGITDQGTAIQGRALRLSLYVSPRLVVADGEPKTLAAFGDFLDWPKTVSQITDFAVHFEGGETRAAFRAQPSPLRSDLWVALFNENTPVRSHEFEDYTKRLIVSYDAGKVLQFIKHYYQEVGFHSYKGLPPKSSLRDDRNDYTDHFLSRENSDWVRDLAIDWTPRNASSLRDSLHRERFNPDIIGDSPDVHGVPQNGTNAINPAERRKTFEKLLLFHTPKSDIKYPHIPRDKRPKLPPLPDTGDAFEATIDFHQALSSLGDYPELMRYLGLVIDLEVPPDPIFAANTKLQVVPNWTSSEAVSPQNKSSFTAYIYNDQRFEAAPRSTTNPAIEHGLLKLNSGDHELAQVDIDGAALKAVNFAISLSHEPEQPADDTPETAGLPTLRTAGFSLLRTGRDEQVYNHFNSAKTLNDALDGNGEVLLYAEDLVRGYRIDIWHSIANNWYSLCRRVGNYSFTSKNIQLQNVEDEGFVQMGMTQAPPEQAGEQPSKDNDLYLHESLFHWEGWSLVAPRPGRSIISHQGAADTVDTPKNEPLTAFKLSTAFRAAPRSLPQLRFGVGYRIRARAVDLAGNSISMDDATPDTAIPSSPEPEAAYLRYEPVAAPQIVLRKAITVDNPGESLTRLVIRTFNNTPALDNQPINEIEERHIAPPRSNQQMLEALGVFDGANGQLMGDSTTYNLIASKDKAVNPSATDSPVEGAEQMPITYLHDVLAVGAALRDLPGTPVSTVGEADSTELIYQPLPGIDTRPGSVTKIPYGAITETPNGLLALYTFDDKSGDVVHDVSGVGKPLDLRIHNPAHVSWGVSKLTVSSKTLIQEIEPGHKLINGIKSSGALSIEAWITPANLTQNGPARIVTIGDDPFKRNITLGQGQGSNQPSDLFEVRLRTTQTDENGLPAVKTQPGTAKAELTHVVFTRRAGEAVIYINGVPALTANSKGDLSNWTSKARFALACEPSNDFPWLGTYHLVAVYNRALRGDEVQQHYANGPVLEKDRIPLYRRLNEAKTFRLALAEGDSTPAWNGDKRILSVQLPKATTWTTPLSSYLDGSELRLMGMWEWLREYVDQQIEAASDIDTLEQLTYQVADMSQYTLEGGFWMLTPAQTVTLVHAVQQPLGQPQIEALQSRREQGKTFSKFAGRLSVHGKSTAKVDLLAQWTEMIDAPLEPSGPTTRDVTAQHVAEIPLKVLDGLQPLTWQNRDVGMYEPDSDSILLSPTESPEHQFGDTKHRRVTYWASASSRYQEYFEPNTPGGFSRVSEKYTINVPASESPSPPKVKYVIPAYGWKRQTATNMIASHRQGGGLRVYLERPWFSSGDGELLGVVLWNGEKLNNEQREDLKPYISQWGQDPIWESELGRSNQADNSVPKLSQFSNRTASGDSIWMPALNRTVDVAGHAVAYDAERQLWYCDIHINPGKIYYPFIRLALARYQPHALWNTHLSPVTLAEFAQLAPNRSTILTYDPYQADRVHLTVSGFTYVTSTTPTIPPGTPGSRIEIRVEMRPEGNDELDWIPTDLTPVEVGANSGQLLWKGYIDDIGGMAKRRPGQYRVVIREYEDFLTYDPSVSPSSIENKIPPTVPTSRLVYADVIVL